MYLRCIITINACDIQLSYWVNNMVLTDYGVTNTNVQLTVTFGQKTITLEISVSDTCYLPA